MSALNVRCSILVIMLYGVIGSIADFRGTSFDFVDLLSSNGNLENCLSGIPLSSALFLFTIVAYINYMCALNRFARCQVVEEDVRAVLKIRSGLIWSIVATVVGIIPFLGAILGLVFSIVAFFITLAGYNRLRRSGTFPLKARYGAALLFASMFVVLGGDVWGVLPVLGSVVQAVSYAIAAVLMLIGWRKIELAPKVSQSGSMPINMVEDVAPVVGNCSSRIVGTNNEPVQGGGVAGECNAKKKTLMKYIVLGCLSILIVTGVVLPFMMSGSEDSEFNLPAPEFSKFVVAKRNGIKSYRTPDKSSLTVCVARERLESCTALQELCWADRDSDNRWSVMTLKLDRGTVLPVIEELDGWYKVQVGDSEGCMPLVAYVEKRYFNEVEFEPLTFGNLEVAFGLENCRMLQDGRYEGLCLVNDISSMEMDGEKLILGELKSGAFVCINPAVWLNIYRHYADTPLDVVCDKGMERYLISYDESKACYSEYGDSFLGVDKLSVDEVETIIDAGFFDFNTPDVSVYYYLPGVSRTLLRFALMPDDFYMN